MSLDTVPPPRKSRIDNPRYLLAGLLFVAIGIATVAGAADYPLGTFRSIGPGYFPILLGITLSLLGVAIAVRGFARNAAQEAAAADDSNFALRPLICVVAAVIAFGLLVRPFGLAAAVVALIVVSSLAGRDFSMLRVVLLCAGMVLMSWLVFIWLLGLNMTMWPR